MIGEIKKIVHGGYGLAFVEGKTAFIPYSAPGDTVEFSAAREKKNVLFGFSPVPLPANPGLQIP